MELDPAPLQRQIIESRLIDDSTQRTSLNSTDLSREIVKPKLTKLLSLLSSPDVFRSVS